MQQLKKTDTAKFVRVKCVVRKSIWKYIFWYIIRIKYRKSKVVTLVADRGPGLFYPQGGGSFFRLLGGEHVSLLLSRSVGWRGSFQFLLVRRFYLWSLFLGFWTFLPLERGCFLTSGCCAHCWNGFGCWVAAVIQFTGEGFVMVVFNFFCFTWWGLVLCDGLQF